jgi:hypothetical protein
VDAGGRVPGSSEQAVDLRRRGGDRRPQLEIGGGGEAPFGIARVAEPGHTRRCSQRSSSGIAPIGSRKAMSSTASA